MRWVRGENGGGGRAGQGEYNQSKSMKFSSLNSFLCNEYMLMTGFKEHKRQESGILGCFPSGSTQNGFYL